MKRLVTFLIALTLSASAWALAPEIELDRLLLQAKAALDAGDYPQAAESLSKAEKLGVRLPDTFYYHSGRAYGGAGKLEQGRAMFEKYVNMSGTKGKFYQEALVGINNLEAAIKKRDADLEAAMKKREAEKEAKRTEYNEQMARYNKNVDNCPNRFYDEVNSARRSLRDAEDACVNGGSNFCDYHEENNDQYVKIGKTADRISARRYLAKLQGIGAGDWCRDRYSKPTLPEILR